MKCGCRAHMRIKLRKSSDIHLQEWHVTKFVIDHNHELLSPSETRFLPSSRTITEEDEKRILLLKEGGLSVRQIMRVMELEKKIGHGYLPFLERDVRNLFSKIRNKEVVNDVVDLLQYCKLAKQENNNFHFVFTLDEERKLEHIFWVAPHCIDWYKKYGDVVLFDTTYKINAYQMPFGIFVGVNNHGKTILLGCALLRNETTTTFRWLMKTFLGVMKKPPKTIITDQDPWLTEAISLELPSTKHSFCIWHITSKFSGWFTAILRDRYQDWCADFYALYNLDDSEDFEREWVWVVAKYELQRNKHVIGLYKIKHFWVPAYLRGYFFGGMTTTGRSESINAFIKRFIGSHTNLKQFVKQVELAIEDIEHVQMHNTMLETYRGSSLRTMSPLEEQAQKILTPYCFKKFQDEFGMATLYSLISDDGNIFVLKHYEETRYDKRHNVFWDGNTATCSCKHFEFWGILCRHILSVFIRKDCYKIPSYYLPLRWCREAMQIDDRFSSFGEDLQGSENKLVSDENVDIHDDIGCPPISKTKGRPSGKRMKSGKDGGKQEKTCRLCKGVGHNYTTCPEKKNILNGTQKKKKKTTSGDIGLNPIFCVKY